MTHAVHRTVFAVDVEGFGDQRRAGIHQVAVRDGLYRALEKAFSASGIPWTDCHREDRGDGVFVLAPPHVPKALFTESLPAHLAGALREHNVLHCPEAQIRLRVALHAGEIHLDGHGATGKSVNLTFRLLEASELKSTLARAPGVLAMIVSSWFFDEVVQNSPASNPAAFRRVEVAVKETAAIAWIFLPDPQHALVAPRQLPADPHLTGRAAELRQLTSFLDNAPGTRILISGAAGIGKTALALRWAHHVAGRFPDGQLYVDLNGFGHQAPTEAGEALHGFLVSLGVDAPAIPAALAAKAALYRSLLAQRRLLVILDNARDSDHVLPLLPGTFRGVVIITSRSELIGLSTRVDVEHMALDVLGPEEALQILAHQSGQQRIAADPQAAGTLIRLCGGLPLALRITAARAAARPRLPLRRLAEELSDEQTRLAALAVSDMGLDLRSVFSWSYRQLPGQAARLFRLLGLHPGQDIDAYAVTALTGTSITESRRSINSLLSVHLLEERFPDRFAMHDLLNTYARELARAEPDHNDSLIRLFDYYLEISERADRFIAPHRYRVPLDISRPAAFTPVIDSYGKALEWLHSEQGNLLAVCQMTGKCFESRSWQLAYTLRGYFFLTKRWDAWIQTHELALAACLSSGDRRAEAITRNNLGRALLESGRQEEAVSHYGSARRLFEELDDYHGLSNTLANQATIMRRQGRLDEALRNNHRALTHYRQVGARRNTAITLRSISLVELEYGRLSDARNHAEEALGVFIELGIQVETAKCLSYLGLILQRCGASASAEDAYQRAIEISRQCGSPYEEARALHWLGAIFAARGATDEAVSRWNRALELYRLLGAAKAEQVAADLSTLADWNNRTK
jgi:tetratricopeptide (TPR) repeat protein